MAPLIVNKALEHRGKIGPFFLHEVIFLTLGGMVLFLLVLFVRSYVPLSRLWLLSGPALFFVVMGLVKVLRQEDHPSLFLSWLSWRWKQPKHLGPSSKPFKYPPFCHPSKGTQTVLFDPLKT